jgi:DNA-binding GntR family transcriptional regulator
MESELNPAIYLTVKDRILFLEYQPGQILNEKVLADEFGVSRTPLRDVLGRLEWDQLVRILPRTGIMVTEIEFQKMMYTYQVRFEIEELIGKLAGDHRSDSYLQRIDALGHRCEQLFDQPGSRELVSIDIAFRQVLGDAANNPVLRDIDRQLYDGTRRLWYFTLQRGPWAEEVHAMHDDILTTRAAWIKHRAPKFGTFRRAMLERHFERIRAKFLNPPITA